MKKHFSDFVNPYFLWTCVFNAHDHLFFPQEMDEVQKRKENLELGEIEDKNLISQKRHFLIRMLKMLAGTEMLAFLLHLH